MTTLPITCAADNVAEFNAALRDHLGPEGVAFAKALYRACLITGLRDVTISPAGSLPGGVVPVLSAEAEQRITAAHARRGVA